MSDHSVISMVLTLNNIELGKGYFKINNSLILQTEYQDKIRKSISEIAEINKNANPNTLWEIIKGGIRDESIKYASYEKKCKIFCKIYLYSSGYTIHYNDMSGNSKCIYRKNKQNKTKK